MFPLDIAFKQLYNAETGDSEYELFCDNRATNFAARLWCPKFDGSGLTSRVVIRNKNVVFTYEK